MIVHHLLVRGGIDDDMAESLDKKDAVQESMLRALKARIEKAKEKTL